MPSTHDEDEEEEEEEEAPKQEIKRQSTQMEPWPKVPGEAADADEQERATRDSDSSGVESVDLKSPILPNEVLEIPSRHSNTLSIQTVATADDEFGMALKRASQRTARSGSSSSRDSIGSTGSSNVDWEQLEKNEENEVRDEATDESTAFLLARLERENQLLSQDPKSQVTKTRARNASRPPSIQQLKRMANDPSNKSALRYSLLPSPPPMTELEFWSALVRDYAQTAQRLPTLTSNKIRSGIPPPLRGVVWVSIAGARDTDLEETYEKLCNESSPYEKLIGKDVGRSFPGVDMFRDPDGEGQQMLGKVLNAYSLWDAEIGYCQGLGFVVGPLIMHMSDKDAFCVLVKLMQSYDLRNCFLPDLSGLHLRIYQFQNLLQQHLPDVTAHLEKLKVEPLYVSQWFLSFFGVNCPLPMLIRIYDILLTEGASETLMRVALSLMRRNEQKILALTEFEDVMGLLLSRGLWDTYDCNADDLVNDFVGWTGLVTRDGLSALEESFKQQSTGNTENKSQKVESAAARFLGRFWASASPTNSPNSKNSVTSPTLATPATSQNDGVLKRTPSKQSMASTLNSVDSSDTLASAGTSTTELTNGSRQQSEQFKPGHGAKPSMSSRNFNKDLHTQIEDLLMAMNDLQREQAMLANELQREREEREEDRAVVSRVIERINKRKTLVSVPEDEKHCSSDDSDDTVTEDPVSELESHFTSSRSKRSSLVLQTKLQLRDELTRWKTQYNEELYRSNQLSGQLTDKDREIAQFKDQLRDARTRIADSHRDKQRLEKVNRDMRLKPENSPRASIISLASNDSAATPKGSGLREFRLGRATTTPTGPQPPASRDSVVFNKRTSSLSAQSILSTDDKPQDHEAVLLELVNSKTSEAVARQELEECKAKLDALRKMLSGNNPSPGAVGHTAGSLSVSNAIGLTRSEASKAQDKKDEEKKPAPQSAGWFGGGWGKRAVSGTGS